MRKGDRVVCAGIHMNDIRTFPYRHGVQLVDQKLYRIDIVTVVSWTRRVGYGARATWHSVSMVPQRAYSEERASG
ncbi:hypothetical protein [Lichenicola cladoniae]|uniref:hypothetical protein n=1 Tax=Lichenicola cladoniae TaxID=1484109 RepID=UPI001954F93E